MEGVGVGSVPSLEGLDGAVLVGRGLEVGGGLGDGGDSDLLPGAGGLLGVKEECGSEEWEKKESAGGFHWGLRSSGT
jgi:hypothetical protein